MSVTLDYQSKLIIYLKLQNNLTQSSNDLILKIRSIEANIKNISEKMKNISSKNDKKDLEFYTKQLKIAKNRYYKRQRQANEIDDAILYILDYSKKIDNLNKQIELFESQKHEFKIQGHKENLKYIILRLEENKKAKDVLDQSYLAYISKVDEKYKEKIQKVKNNQTKKENKYLKNKIEQIQKEKHDLENINTEKYKSQIQKTNNSIESMKQLSQKISELQNDIDFLLSQKETLKKSCKENDFKYLTNTLEKKQIEMTKLLKEFNFHYSNAKIQNENTKTKDNIIENKGIENVKEIKKIVPKTNIKVPKEKRQYKNENSLVTFNIPWYKKILKKVKITIKNIKDSFLDYLLEEVENPNNGDILSFNNKKQTNFKEQIKVDNSNLTTSTTKIQKQTNRDISNIIEK